MVGSLLVTSISVVTRKLGADRSRTCGRQETRGPLRIRAPSEELLYPTSTDAFNQSSNQRPHVGGGQLIAIAEHPSMKTSDSPP
jgi:hypothetical protein